MIIGVTGSFGSGKSSVSHMLARLLKAKIIDADKIAKSMLYRRDVIRQIKNAFPEAVSKWTVNRKKLASIVFRNKQMLAKLEKIIHPPVTREIKERIKGDVVLDVPLLIEAGLHEMCDAVIVVRCKEKIRIKRLMKKGFSLQEIKARTSMQLPLKKKIAHADYTIDNSRSLKETEQQVKQILKKIS